MHLLVTFIIPGAGTLSYECYQGYVRDIREDFIYMDLEYVLHGPISKNEIHGKLAINKKYIITIFELNDTDK